MPEANPLNSHDWQVRLIATDDLSITVAPAPLTRRDRAVLRFNDRKPFGYVWGRLNGKRRFFRPYG